MSPESVQHSPGANAGGERLQVLPGLAGEQDHREAGQFLAQLLLVQQRAVAADIAGLLQRLDPPQAWRRRDADPARQIDIGHAPVRLQFPKYCEIDGVQSVAQALPR